MKYCPPNASDDRRAESNDVDNQKNQPDHSRQANGKVAPSATNGLFTVRHSEAGMGYGDEIEMKSLIGEKLTHVDTNEHGDEILLTTESGRQIRIHHHQDCCESVQIETTEGEWREIIGKIITDASQDVQPEGEPRPEYAESWTRTEFTFKADDTTIVSKWIGESNGYYSEDVSIEEVTTAVQ